MGKLGGGELNFSSDIDLDLRLSREGRDRRARAPHRQRGLLHAPRPARDPPARRAHRAMASCSASTCGCARSATAGRSSRAPRSSRTTCSARPRLGALRVDQGARAHRPRARTPAHPRRERAAVRLSPLSRLRRVRGAARDEGADREGSRAARSRRARQARARRHPRDRVHRAGVPAHPRRAGPPPADPVAARVAAAARRAASCCRRASRRSSRRPTCSCAASRTGCRCWRMRRRTRSRRTR